MVRGGGQPYLPIDILRRSLDIARLAVDATKIESSFSSKTHIKVTHSKGVSNSNKRWSR